jgi:hypothetical protein
VVLSRKADASSVGVPKVAGTLAAGSASWQAKIDANGQTIPMSITREVKEDGATFVVNETAKLPFGDVVDLTVLDKATLVPVKRSVKQGPVAIELAFAGGKATGTMAMGGDPKPVAVDMGGDLFADGAGANDVLALLPLADGYTTTFRNLDVQKQKTSLKQAKVVGHEDVTVPAGTFKAWKLEITSAEGEPGQTTLWVSEDHKPLKVVATVPQMGNAVITAERQ